MRLEVEGTILNAGAAVKVSWGDRTLYGTIRHRSQRDGSTVLGIKLSSSWESFLEEILARHAEELESSRAALQSFSYLASHEMHETLSVVLLYLDLATRSTAVTKDDQTLPLLRYAQSAATRIRDLTHGLATYSTVLTESLNTTPVNCDRLVTAIANGLAGQNASLTHDRLPILMADGRELRMVFQHLISNGLKFNHSPQPSVHVSAKFKGTEWIFAVNDNGIGIDTAAQEQLFQPFSRLHNDCDLPAGIGLGLTLTRQIIKKHGGRIWVESKPGQGSTFYFTVPASSTPWA